MKYELFAKISRHLEYYVMLQTCGIGWFGSPCSFFGATLRYAVMSFPRRISDSPEEGLNDMSTCRE